MENETILRTAEDTKKADSRKLKKEQERLDLLFRRAERNMIDGKYFDEASRDELKARMKRILIEKIKDTRIETLFDVQKNQFEVGEWEKLRSSGLVCEYFAAIFIQCLLATAKEFMSTGRRDFPWTSTLVCKSKRSKYSKSRNEVKERFFDMLFENGFKETGVEISNFKEVEVVTKIEPERPKAFSFSTVSGKKFFVTEEGSSFIHTIRAGGEQCSYLIQEYRQGSMHYTRKTKIVSMQEDEFSACVENYKQECKIYAVDARQFFDRIFDDRFFLWAFRCEYPPEGEERAMFVWKEVCHNMKLLIEKSNITEWSIKEDKMRFYLNQIAISVRFSYKKKCFYRTDLVYAEVMKMTWNEVKRDVSERRRLLVKSEKKSLFRRKSKVQIDTRHSS